MFLKRLFYACASLFLLALAYHLGASSAGAQSPGNPVVAAIPPTQAGGTANGGCVVTANGDVYRSLGGAFGAPWAFAGNVFSTATPTTETSFGALKVKGR